VLLRGGASIPPDAAAAAPVSNAGGTLVASYRRSRGWVLLRRVERHESRCDCDSRTARAGAARTDGFATKVRDVMDNSGPVVAPILRRG